MVRLQSSNCRLNCRALAALKSPDLGKLTMKQNREKNAEERSQEGPLKAWKLVFSLTHLICERNIQYALLHV